MEQRVFRRRIIVGAFLLIAIIVFLIIRFASLHFSSKIILNSNQQLNIRRGLITDRRGHLLAMSVEYRSLFANPHELADIQQTSRALSPVLGLSAQSLMNKLSGDRHFVWLYRKLDDYRADIIQKLNIKGLYFKREFKRVYPYGRLASNILGFAGIDNSGLEGIEYNFNDILIGKDRDDSEEAQYGLKLGNNITLTIDAYIQYESEKEIKEAVARHGAKQGVALVLEVHTGRILALAKYPDFNPNRYYDYTPFSRRNFSVIDAIEPGSTMKIISLASLIEKGYPALKRRYLCEGSITIGDATINCTGIHGNVGMSEIISKSCNVGIILAMKDIKKDEFYSMLQRFGFGKRACGEFPGETDGILRPPAQWSGLSKYSMAIGHEMSATSLQIAAAFAAIANGGTLYSPAIIESIESSRGDKMQSFSPRSKGQIISPSTAAVLMKLMRGVVQKGTGEMAASYYYSVVGKTGTSKKFIRTQGSYSDRVISSFAGIAPYQEPDVCILVLIDDPLDKQSGGTIAAPVFAHIVDKILPYRGVKNSSIRPELPIHKKRGKKIPHISLMPDFRDMDLKESMAVLSVMQDEHSITYRVSGTGRVYAQKPLPRSTVKEKQRILLYLK